jgi:uncharacterized protein YdhG (YjbR/CyaY superfamily)
MKKYQSVDAYIADFPPNIRGILENIRRVIKESAPEAREAISYGMPTFKLNGNLVHFAAWKNHIGLYPTPSAGEAFKKELSGYKTSKGSVQFPMDQPIPFDLIEEIVKYRVNEVLNKE